MAWAIRAGSPGPGQVHGRFMAGRDATPLLGEVVTLQSGERIVRQAPISFAKRGPAGSTSRICRALPGARALVRGTHEGLVARDVEPARGVGRV